MMAPDITWPDVVYAFVPTVPGIVSAYFAYRARAELRTPTGKPVGELVAEAHSTVDAVASRILPLEPEKPS